MAEGLSGKIQTVRGLISPSDLGQTYTHEHLCLNFQCAYFPAKAEEKAKETMPITLENLGWIRQNPYSHLSNMLIKKDDAQAITDELNCFKKNGGSCIVENTTKGIDRDVKRLHELSTQTGVHIVAGSGYYEGCTHPPNMSSINIEELVREMTSDLTTGCDGTAIRCGVIGEIGTAWPIAANEKRVLQATAQTQESMGCPVIIHPGRHHEAPFEVIRILQEAGGDIRKTVMSHLDRTIDDYSKLCELAETGVYCEYDMFGIEVSLYQRNPSFDMPSDAQRIRGIRHLIQEGYGDQIVIGHDVHTKHRLMKYGGHGYSHILLYVLPMMRTRGISNELINKILVENPRRWLTFK